MVELLKAKDGSLSMQPIQKYHLATQGLWLILLCNAPPELCTAVIHLIRTAPMVCVLNCHLSDSEADAYCMFLRELKQGGGGGEGNC